MHIRRRDWIILAVVLGALVVVTAASVVIRLPLSSDALRKRIIAALAESLEAEVELRALTFHFYPHVHASGEGLTVRFDGRHDVPPLVSIDRFAIDASLVGLWRHRVARAELTGLAINIPPPSPGEDDPATNNIESPPASDNWMSYAHAMTIDVLEAPDAQLTILRRDPDKPPRVWYMHQLRMRNVQPANAIPFETLLTNAVPPGQIAASGQFGPWARDTPGATPLEGRFTFDNADLSVFNGISGILTAHGTFDGTLDRLAVSGETDTPNFMVNMSGHQLPLHTTYRAVVDATNGNTSLDPVDATIVNTRIVARGGVYQVEGVHGRVVRLDVAIEDGQLEDVMRMVVRTPHPPMTGGLRLSTRLTIPPGKRDIVDKLELDGRFGIVRGRFTAPAVQAKVNDLSRRASGRRVTTPEAAPRVTSTFQGQFALSDGRMSMRTLVFDVPGAVVSIAGEYGLRQQTLAFDGDLVMDAKLSQTMTGWRSLFLKLVDPLFLRNGKTAVPLTVSGTWNDPQFGVNVRRVFRH